MKVQWQQNAEAPVENITAVPIYLKYWAAQGDQVDVCEDRDCNCRWARTNRCFSDDSEAKAIIGLIDEYYEELLMTGPDTDRDKTLLAKAGGR